jgi:hypothetical protein
MCPRVEVSFLIPGVYPVATVVIDREKEVESDGYRIYHGHEDVNEKVEEVPVIEVTDAVGHPRAVVIHVENQFLQSVIVMRTGGLRLLGAHAEAPLMRAEKYPSRAAGVGVRVGRVVVVGPVPPARREEDLRKGQAIMRTAAAGERTTRLVRKQTTVFLFLFSPLPHPPVAFPAVDKRIDL